MAEVIYVFHDEHGRLIGLAFREAPTEPKLERAFLDNRDRLIASVIAA